MMAYPVIKWIPYYEPYYTDENGRRQKAAEPEGTVIDAAFAPETTAEGTSIRATVDGVQQRVISDARLFLRTPIQYSQRDFFRVDGVLYNVMGQNPGWYGRYSRRCFGQEIFLKRIGG